MALHHDLHAQGRRREEVSARECLEAGSSTMFKLIEKTGVLPCRLLLSLTNRKEHPETDGLDET